MVSSLAIEVMEIFKDIAGYEGRYQVSNTGKIRSLINNIILKSSLMDRYLGVTISKGTKDSRKSYKIHVAVAEAFILNPENKPQVNHLDGDKTNNNDWNLAWATPAENIQHAHDIGLSTGAGKGEKHFNAKLNFFDILYIRDFYKRKVLNQKEIAKIFKTNQQQISQIVLYKRWSHVP